MSTWLQYVITGVAVGAFYALVALAMQVSFSASRVLNFAQGELVVAGAFIMYAYSRVVGLSPWLALVLTVVSGGCIGAAFELVVLRGLGSHAVVIGTLATVAAGAALRGLYTQIFGTDSRAVPPLIRHSPIRFGDYFITYNDATMVTGATVCLVGLFLLSTRTWLGRSMRAAASNPTGALVVGIKPTLVRLLAFTISGALSGLAGALIAPSLGAQFNSGFTFVLGGFTGALLGGLGSPVGAVGGGLALGVATAVVVGQFGADYEPVWICLIIMVTLYLRPTGLFGGLARA